jgi:hypothetical protein
MVKSFGVFVVGILKKIYWLLPSLLSDPFDIAERWLSRWPSMNYNPPQWLFWVLLGIGLFIASFLTYYDVKRKLDEMSEEFYFEPTGNDLTETNRTVHLNVTFRAKPKVIVDELYLDINGMRLAPLRWAPFVVSPQYTDNWAFALSGKVKQGDTYIGKLIAMVDKKEHPSRQFEVHT